MKDIKNLKGQTDSIVLYVLISGDRHTDELKELIDSLFSEVKIGTLYSVISRLKTQQLINEYRASSSDGSRRKYYKITEKGKKEYNEKYADLFTDCLPIPVREEPVKEIVKPVKEEKPVTEKKVELAPETTESDYSTYIHSATVTAKSSDIDFSMFEEEPTYKEVKTTTPITTKTEKDDFTVDDFNLKKDMEREDAPVKAEVEINTDSASNPKYEYGSVLTELFPKTVAVPTSVETTPETVLVNDKTSSDMGELYELAEKDGIKIRTSNDTNRYQGTKILINILRFHTSLIWLCLFVLEFVVVSLLMNKNATINVPLLVKTTLILAIIPAILGIISFINSKRAVKDMFKFKDVLTISLTLMITTIIITIALAVLQTLDYSNFNVMFNSVVLPIIIAIDIPLFFVIEYSLAQLEFYQVI